MLAPQVSRRTRPHLSVVAVALVETWRGQPKVAEQATSVLGGTHLVLAWSLQAVAAAALALGLAHLATVEHQMAQMEYRLTTVVTTVKAASVQPRRREAQVELGTLNVAQRTAPVDHWVKADAVETPTGVTDGLVLVVAVATTAVAAAVAAATAVAAVVAQVTPTLR